MAGGSSNKKSSLHVHNTSETDLLQLVENALASQAETFEKHITIHVDVYKQYPHFFSENTNLILDGFLKIICERKASLEFTQKEVADLKASMASTTADTLKVQKNYYLRNNIDGLVKATDYFEGQ